MFPAFALNSAGQVQAVTSGTVTSFNGPQAYVGSSPLVTVDAIEVADTFTGGFRYRADGALRVNDGTGAFYLQGFAVTANGQLCIDTGAVSGTTQGGVAITADGRVSLSTGGAAYLGPLDLVPGIDAAYSTGRALRAALLDQDIFTIKRLDGGGEPTESFAASASGISVAAVNSFLDGDDGEFTEFVDHTGNGNTVLSIGDLFWDDSVVGGRPGIFSDTSGQGDGSGLSLSFSVGCTVIAVATAGIEITCGPAAKMDFYLHNGVGSAGMSLEDSESDFAGTAVDDALPAGVHIYVASWRNGQSVFSIDGVEQANTPFDTGDIGPFSLSETTIFFNETASCCEWYIASPQLSASDINNVLLPNIQSFWGTPALP